MYNEGFTSLKHKNYVEGKQNKYGCHGNQDCYLSPYYKENIWVRVTAYIIPLGNIHRFLILFQK